MDFDLELGNEKLQSSRGDNSEKDSRTDRWTVTAPPWVMSNSCLMFQGLDQVVFELEHGNEKLKSSRGDKPATQSQQNRENLTCITLCIDKFASTADGLTDKRTD